MLWKTWGGRCIYRGAHGIRVYQNPLYRWLKFDSNALQTLINRWLPARPGLNYIKPLTCLARSYPGNCCVLGLGGAGVLHSLAKPLQNFTVTAVEYNHEVIEVATNFFNLNQLAQVNIIQQDAADFVQDCQCSFEHLVVDLFNADCFPENCKNDSFFSHCKNLLTPNGILAVNLANYHERGPIFSLIKQQFPRGTLVIPVKNSANMVIMASRNKKSGEIAELLAAKHQLKKLSWQGEWGYVAEL